MSIFHKATPETSLLIQPCHKLVRILLSNLNTSGNLHSKRARTNRHRPYQRWPYPFPKTHYPLPRPCLLEAVPHALEFLTRSKAITLHFALNHVKRITRNPQRLTRKTTVKRNFGARNRLSRRVVALHVRIHEIFKSQKPHAVGLCFAQHRHRLSVEQALHHTLVPRQLADAVPR